MRLSTQLGVSESDRHKIIAAGTRVEQTRSQMVDQFDATLAQHLRSFKRDFRQPLGADQVSAAIDAALASVGVPEKP